MKNSQQKPSEAELAILQVVWVMQPVTVREIHEVLSRKRKVVYTTTLKQMQRMVEKNLLERKESEKGHIYFAKPKEDEIKNQLFEKLVETLFKGSAMDLVMHALGRSKTSKEELKMLKEWLDRKEEENGQ